jgi:hypothetical protein
MNKLFREVFVKSYKQIQGKVNENFNIKKTPYIKFLSNYFNNRPLVLCEVGVYEGMNAVRMFRNLNVSRMYLVDLWGKTNYKEGDCANSEKDWSKFYDVAKKNLNPFNDKTIFIRDYSSKAVDSINEMLDAVYIDANHDYSAVMNDLRTYYPIVKKGGIIGGHDWCPRYPGVSRAVNKFFDNPKMVCNNNERTEWWLVK